MRAAAGREAHEEAGLEVEVGEPLQVASNFHEPEKPTVGIWFAATLRDRRAVPVAGDDAVAVGWFDPARVPPLAFPTDAALLAKLAGGQRSRPVRSTSGPSPAASAAVRKRPKRRSRAR